MAKVTSLEVGLKRILGLCPDIVLNPREIQLIIDGNINQVLCEARGNEWKGAEVESEDTTTKDDQDNEVTVDLTEDSDDIDNGVSVEADDNKSFNDYF